MRTAVSDRLRFSPAEPDSLVGLLQSDLDLSLRRALRSQDSSRAHFAATALAPAPLPLDRRGGDLAGKDK
jgi:hypothetical protein